MNMKNWMRSVSNQPRRRSNRTTKRRLFLQPLEVRELLAVDAFEPNASFGTAGNLGSSSTTYSVTIEPAGDVDYFRWQAPASGVVRFDALFSQAQGDLDMRLYDSNFNEIDASISLDDNERVRTTVTTGQQVYVKVSEFSGIKIVPYSLKVTFIQPDAIDAVTPNNSIATPHDLGTGPKSISNLNIHNAADVDFFRWTATTSGNLTVNANFAHSDGDLNLAVLTPGGTEIISSSSSTDNESVTFSATAGTSYIIRVNEAQGHEHPGYTLQVGFSSPPSISDIPLTLGTIGGVTLVNFQVSDPDTPLSSLVLTASSTDQFLVPNSNISFSGTGADRTAVISSPGGFGFVNITFTVTDPSGNSDSDSFDLGLFLTNGAPVISSINDITVAENSSSGIINFTVSDPQTPANQLAVTATSSNTSLIPNNNIVLGGSDTNRTIRVTPLPNTIGSSIITVTVTDGDNATSHETFVVTVFDSANMPTISPINDVTINEDTSTGPIAFTLSDADTSPSFLNVTVGSSNAGVVPVSGVVIGGSGANRTVTVTPAPNVSGQSTITLTVSDGSASSTESFLVNVVPLNDLPTITNIANVTLAQGSSMPATPFTVGDVETDPNNLTVTAASNNPFLVPLDRIILGGTGASRTIAINPLPDRQGTATITLTVNDGNGGATTTSFDLTVSGPDDGPSISPILNQTIMVGATSSVAFTVSDDIKPASELFVTAFSSDQSIIEDDDLSVTGTGENRLLHMTPSMAGGPITISVVVSDGINNSTTQFQVTVLSSGPSISAIADQVINEDGSTGALAFTVADSNTPVESLVVTAVSNNQSLVANANVVLGGSGANRTVTVTPLANAHGGPATITVTVSDGTATATETFDVTVTPINDTPNITAVADQVIEENTATGTLAFTIADVDSPIDTLTVSASSNNQAIVPNGNIVLGGSGAARSVNVLPAANASGGPVTITLTVSDGTTSATETFNVTVVGTDLPPSISAIADQVIDENASTGALAFTLTDLDTPLDNLTVTATSNNQSIIPNGNIVLAGTGANRTVTATPLPNVSGGPVTITVTVTDGTTSASEAFTVTVNDVVVDVIGDANRDGVFNSSDLVEVFAAGEYEDGIPDNSTWEEGDWNGDGDFDSSDLVDAFAAGTYETGAASPATLSGDNDSSNLFAHSPAKLVDLAMAADDLVSGEDLLDRSGKRMRI